MSRLTPERLEAIRAIIALENVSAAPVEKYSWALRDALSEIDALRQERGDKWGPSDRAYLERDQAREYAEELAARVRELETLLRSIWVYGPLSSDSWEDEWRDLVKVALGPTRRDA